MSEALRSFSFAAGVLAGLRAGGAAGICVSPGSRSTPLVLAAVRTSGLPVHVHLDERSASFFALGLARASRQPVVVFCTSGTAAANHLPAVVEAAASRTPLIVITADRPARLRGTGANQTIEQRDLFGVYPRLSVDVDASSDPVALARRAVEAALGSPPGPVHLNIQFDEPLVPTDTPEGPVVEPFVVERVEGGSADAVGAVADLLGGNERGVIVVGDLIEDAPSLVALSRASGWPLIAEPLSNLRVPGALDVGLHAIAGEQVDAVLQVGRAPMSRTTRSMIARARSVVCVAEPGVPAVADDAPVFSCSVESLATGVGVARGNGEWWETLHARATRIRSAIDGTLSSLAHPTEARVARDVVDACADGTTIFLGNSMPVRDVDAFARPRAGLRFLGNRGASGIDGTVSTALGIASTGARTVALLGDLAMLHDASGLLWAARRASNIVFIVPDNRGGGIFDLVGHGDLPERDDYFVATHQVDLAALADAAGITFVDTDDITAVVNEPGPLLVRVPIDRGQARSTRAELARVIAAAQA